MPAAARQLYLCGGLQSSGSTLVSWCFLQRPDTDGVLDARFDMLPAVPSIAAPNLWVKFTIACFRFTEVADHFRDGGFEPVPLLVTRDVRAVVASLRTKPYGRNGTTADDPPIRLRLRRFREDWQTFRDRGWPVLSFEKFLADGEGSLRATCAAMGLPWADAMVRWGKPIEAVAAAGYGNETFLRNRRATLADSVAAGRSRSPVSALPPADVEWLDREFAEFNRESGYPERLPPVAERFDGPDRDVPTFENTRRYNRLARRHPVARLVRRWTGSPPLTPAEVAAATGVPVPAAAS